MTDDDGEAVQEETHRLPELYRREHRRPPAPSESGSGEVVHYSNWSDDHQRIMEELREGLKRLFDK